MFKRAISPCQSGSKESACSYFFARPCFTVITTPEKDLWVNLSPYEKDRIIPESFGQTDMGRDLLAQDYILKQITASLIYPEDELGKKFWKRIYEEAAKKFGTTNIPVNTFNKVWIVPEHAKVYEHGNTAFIVNARLKVMLEEDYLSMSKHECRGDACHRPQQHGRTQGSPLQNDVNALGSQIIREIVLPQLEKEVNEGKNFATLRQVYHSLILAVWFKKRMSAKGGSASGGKDSILWRQYMDQNKVEGIHYENTVIPDDAEAIYHRYLQAFKKGVYNYIKEETDPVTQQMIPRKYFSGGFSMRATVERTKFSSAMTAVEQVAVRENSFKAVAINLATQDKNPPETFNQNNAQLTNHAMNTDVMTVDGLQKVLNAIFTSDKSYAFSLANAVVAAVGAVSQKETGDSAELSDQVLSDILFSADHLIQSTQQQVPPAPLVTTERLNQQATGRQIYNIILQRFLNANIPIVQAQREAAKIRDAFDKQVDLDIGLAIARNMILDIIPPPMDGYPLSVGQEEMYESGLGREYAHSISLERVKGLSIKEFATMMREEQSGHYAIHEMNDEFLPDVVQQGYLMPRVVLEARDGERWRSKLRSAQLYDTKKSGLWHPAEWFFVNVDAFDEYHSPSQERNSFKSGKAVFFADLDLLSEYKAMNGLPFKTGANEKILFTRLGVYGDVVLSELMKNGVLEEVSSTEVRLIENLDSNIDRIWQIIKEHVTLDYHQESEIRRVLQRLSTSRFYMGNPNVDLGIKGYDNNIFDESQRFAINAFGILFITPSVAKEHGIHASDSDMPPITGQPRIIVTETENLYWGVKEFLQQQAITKKSMPKVSGRIVQERGMYYNAAAWHSQRLMSRKAIDEPVDADGYERTALHLFNTSFPSRAYEMALKALSLEPQRPISLYIIALVEGGVFYTSRLERAIDLGLPSNLAKDAEHKIKSKTTNTGGIDLTADRMKVDVARDDQRKSPVRGDKAQISAPVDLKALENIEINGLYIKDIEIKPLNNLPAMLGVSN